MFLHFIKYVFVFIIFNFISFHRSAAEESEKNENSSFASQVYRNRLDPYIKRGDNRKTTESKSTMLIIGADPSSIEHLNSVLHTKVKRIQGKKSGGNLKKDITQTNLLVWNGQKLWTFDPSIGEFKTENFNIDRISELLELVDPEAEGTVEIAVTDDSSRIGFTLSQLISILLKLNALMLQGKTEISFSISGEGTCSQLLALTGLRNLDRLLNNLVLKYLPGRKKSHVHVTDRNSILKIATQSLPFSQHQEKLFTSFSELDSEMTLKQRIKIEEDLEDSDEVETLFEDDAERFADEQDYKKLLTYVKPKEAIGGHLKIFIDTDSKGNPVLKADQRIPGYMDFDVELRLLSLGKRRSKPLTGNINDLNFDHLGFRSKIFSQKLDPYLKTEEIQELEIYFPKSKKSFSIKLADLVPGKSVYYFYEVLAFDRLEASAMLAEINKQIEQDLISIRKLQIAGYEKISSSSFSEEFQLGSVKPQEVRRLEKILQKDHDSTVSIISTNTTPCAASFNENYLKQLKSQLSIPNSADQHHAKIASFSENFQKATFQRRENLDVILARYVRGLFLKN